MVQMVLILATFLFLASTPGPAGTKMEVRHEDGGHEEVDHATVFVGSFRVAL